MTPEERYPRMSNAEFFAMTPENRAKYVAAIQRWLDEGAHMDYGPPNPVVGQSDTSDLKPCPFDPEVLERWRVAQRGADAAAVERLVEESKTWRPK